MINQQDRDCFKITDIFLIDFGNFDYSLIDFDYIFTNDIDKIEKNIKGLSKFMRSITTASGNVHNFYYYRQTLVTLKVKIARLLAELNKEIIKVKKDIYKEYKVPTPGTYAGDNQIKLKNDYERDIFIGSDVRKLQNAIDLSNSYFNFVCDSLKTIDQMIYGVDHIIKFHDKVSTKI